MVTINEQPMVAMTSIDGYLLCGRKREHIMTSARAIINFINNSCAHSHNRIYGTIFNLTRTMRNQVNGTETPKTKSGGYIISFQDQNGIGYRGMRMWIVFRFNQILAVLYELHVEFSSCMTLYG